MAQCWSLRPDADDIFRVDTAPMLAPEDQPFTTLAWRLWHLISCYASTRNATLLAVDASGGGFDPFDAAPPTAIAALDALDAAYGWWAAMLVGVTDERLAEKLGPAAGPYADSSQAAFVLHQLDEVIHHGSETALIRDLYRAHVTHPRMRPASLAEAAAGGYWAEVRSLVASGGDVTPAEPAGSGRTALHYAAAFAPLDVVSLLVDGGADLAARDQQFDATPLGWAEYFGRDDIADYLRGIA